MTPKRERFVLEYMKDLNASQAAIRAGYSKKNADTVGPRLTSHPEIAEEIRKRREKISAKSELTVELLDRKLLALVNFDPRKLMDEDGRVKKPSEWDDETAAAISGLEVEELFEGAGKDREHVGTLRKVKIADRIKPIELGMRRVGVLRETPAFSVGALTIVIQE